MPNKGLIINHSRAVGLDLVFRVVHLAVFMALARESHPGHYVLHIVQLEIRCWARDNPRHISSTNIVGIANYETGISTVALPQPYDLVGAAEPLRITGFGIRGD